MWADYGMPYSGEHGQGGRLNGTLKQGLFAVPGVGIALLPKLVCPLCWPAYAGLLSSIGLGFLIPSTNLLPLTAGFLTVALLAMVFRAKSRNGYGPFLLGFIAAGGVLLAKFWWDSRATTYGGIGLLIVASLWNAWPRRSGEQCSNCDAKTNQLEEC
jgi:mercuric ion transport protein